MGAAAVGNADCWSNLGDFLGIPLGASRGESLGEARGDSRGLLSGACLCDVDEVASVPAAGLWAAGNAGDPAGAFTAIADAALPRRLFCSTRWAYATAVDVSLDAGPFLVLRAAVARESASARETSLALFAFEC